MVANLPRVFSETFQAGFFPNARGQSLSYEGAVVKVALSGIASVGFLYALSISIPTVSLLYSLHLFGTVVSLNACVANVSALFSKCFIDFQISEFTVEYFLDLAEENNRQAIIDAFQTLKRSKRKQKTSELVSSLLKRLEGPAVNPEGDRQQYQLISFCLREVYPRIKTYFSNRNNRGVGLSHDVLSAKGLKTVVSHLTNLRVQEEVEVLEEQREQQEKPIIVVADKYSHLVELLRSKMTELDGQPKNERICYLIRHRSDPPCVAMRHRHADGEDELRGSHVSALYFEKQGNVFKTVNFEDQHPWKARIDDLVYRIKTGGFFENEVQMYRYEGPSRITDLVESSTQAVMDVTSMYLKPEDFMSFIREDGEHEGGGVITFKHLPLEMTLTAQPRVLMDSFGVRPPREAVPNPEGQMVVEHQRDYFILPQDGLMVNTKLDRKFLEYERIIISHEILK